LSPPKIENFTLSNTKASVLPTKALEKETIHVDSGTVILIKSTISDKESGLRSCKIFLHTTDNFPGIILFHQEMIVSDIHILVDLSEHELKHGMAYVISLEAMNKAGLSVGTSAFLFVDNSPPVPGRVLDGANEIDLHCHGSNQVIFTIWSPFLDPETSLYYQVQVSTADTENLDHQDLASFGPIIPGEHVQAAVHLESERGGLLRPLDKIYVTVKATNAAGLSSIAVSGPLEVKCATQLCQCSNSRVCL
jgi:hypothetical protein